MSNNIAVDIGFGSTKFITKKHQSKFPSAVSRVKESQADISNASAFEYNGKYWLVGDDGIREALTTRNYNFLYKNAPLLLFKALADAEVDFSETVNVATGLSLLHWSKREEFGNHLSNFIVNRTNVNASIELIPQGKGIYLDYIKTNPQMTDKMVLIVDIGYCSVDVIPFIKGKPLASEAWAAEKGINVIVNELRKILSKEHHYLNLTEARINECMINKSIEIQGEKVDISDIIEEEKENYNELIINELESRNADIFNSASAIVMAGGGAYHFGNNKPKNMVFAPTPFEFSNVRGYYDQLIGSK